MLGCRPVSVRHLLDEARDHLRRLEQRQQGGRTRIAVGIEVMTEAGKGKPVDR